MIQTANHPSLATLPCAEHHPAIQPADQEISRKKATNNSTRRPGLGNHESHECLPLAKPEYVARRFNSGPQDQRQVGLPPSPLRPLRLAALNTSVRNIRQRRISPKPGVAQRTPGIRSSMKKGTLKGFQHSTVRMRWLEPASGFPRIHRPPSQGAPRSAGDPGLWAEMPSAFFLSETGPGCDRNRRKGSRNLSSKIVGEEAIDRSCPTLVWFLVVSRTDFGTLRTASR